MANELNRARSLVSARDWCNIYKIHRHVQTLGSVRTLQNPFCRFSRTVVDSSFALSFPVLLFPNACCVSILCLLILHLIRLPTG